MNGEMKLVKDILAGSKERYQEVLESYKDRLFAVAYHLTGNKQLAEKLIITGFINTYNDLRTYDESTIFSNWLYERFISFFKELQHADKAVPSSYHNPQLIKVEEALHEIDPEDKLPLLLIRILDISPLQVSSLLNLKMEEIDKMNREVMDDIRKNTLSFEYSPLHSHDCYQLVELIDYKDDNFPEEKNNEINDHLEFCPHCRNVLAGLSREKALLDEVLFSPSLQDDFDRKVMDQLIAYKPIKPKHKTWKYQVSVLGLLGAVVIAILFIYPNVQSMASTIKTFLEHGTIYNVWAKGTYVATDKEISIEITEVELDSINMLIYYEVRKGDEVLEDFQYGAIDIYNSNSVKIIDENGKDFPIKLALPEMFHYSSLQDDLGEQIKPHLIVAPLNGDSFPDVFDIEVSLSTLESRYGNWDLTIPIRFDKVEDQTKTVVINEQFTYIDRLEITIIDYTIGRNGARLRYQVNHTDDAIQRITSILEEHEHEFTLNEWLDNNKYIALIPVTENEEHLIPHYFNNWGMEESETMELYFSKYYMDYERYEVKGKVENLDQNMYVKIWGGNYSEPAFFSMTIPFEETERTPLNEVINDIELVDYQLTPLKENENLFELIIRGKEKDGDFFGEINWNIYDDKGEYFPYQGWYHHEDSQKNGLRRLFHVETYDPYTKTETLTLKADSIYMQLYDMDGEKYPLFIKSEAEEDER
ncbi:hypothetical protein BACCIP111883_01381 [Sutcliffiella rhizosphaerae]|uniref:DUF4179 domain-containing protein n=1 Tax=Sutcliffiella rhizosphaerae TaxID=2880967 RepID=A0ABM8YKZ1_9BACI|nr:hypothetical protein BACCIP111883_01381 [Sutcliffiella rhizosphaerae]